MMLWRLRSFPDFVEPCLPSPVERPPAGSDWIHEIKHDGFRLLARRGAAGVRLFTRNGHDWTERFPLIVEALNELKVATCLIDGEAVTCNDSGLAEFNALRGRRGDVHLCAFDLVELDGRDLRFQPLAERRRLLAKLVRKPRPGARAECAIRRGRPVGVRARLPTRLRGHRVEAQKLALPFRSLPRLGQDEESERAIGEARSRRGLG